MSKVIQVDKVTTQTKRENYQIVDHYSRSLFSSRCSKSQHSACKGTVSKKRCSDGKCRCPCHEVQN
jgi:hypothetical protein